MTNPLYENEKQFLRPSGSLGIRRDEEGRSAFRKDYARLLHAPSFRRLQSKTQLFPGGQSDYFRNRLTHSLEVAQIARGIAGKLNSKQIKNAFGKDAGIDTDLVEFAAIAHDLGHPPFGHNGEYALNEVMREHGGFEGNAQTLRILSSVEKKLVRKGRKVSADFGLDLTYRTLASVLKYDFCIPKEQNQNGGITKGYYQTEQALVREIKNRVAPNFDQNCGKRFKTIECSIMDLADDIAYSTYDFEDSLHAGFYTPLDLANEISRNRAIRDHVLERTNAALKEADHEPLEDEGSLLSVLAEIFNFSKLKQKPITTTRKTGKELNALHTAVSAHIFDRGIAENDLIRTQLTAERVGRLIDAAQLVPNYDFPQLSHVKLRRPEMLQVEIMKHLNYAIVIRSPRLTVAEHRGKDIVKKIYGAIKTSEGKLLPMEWRQRYESGGLSEPGESKLRVICDFVACMTDRYAMEFYSRLFDDDTNIYKPL